MPTTQRDPSPERSREKKESSKSRRSDKKEHDRERHHKSSRPHRKSSTKENSASRTSLSSSDSKRRSSVPGPGKEDSLRQSESKTSLPYPTFSKAHSKEAVGSHAGLNVLTPPATDVNASKERLSSLNRVSHEGPPSPPLTDKNAGRPKMTSSVRTATVETIAEEEKKDTLERKDTAKVRVRTSVSNSRLRSSSDLNAPVSPVKSQKERASTPLKRVETGYAAQRSVSQPTRSISPLRTDTATEVATNVSSQATSVAPEQPSIQRPGSKLLPFANPVGPEVLVTPVYAPSHVQERATVDIFVEQGTGSSSLTPGSYGPPPPPPPPPAPDMPIVAPRVDYLLQHGGLNQDVPMNLLYAGKPMAIQQATMSPAQNTAMIANLFEPYTQILNEYEKVFSRNGSLAVATGYRSVARRLLDRLEAVFARDISSEMCSCSMCDYDNDQVEDTRGVSWGEILEMVSGRRDLPSWPPFAFVASTSGLGITLEMHIPMQELDIDVPEEYREHYIRQSRKTKQSVDKWLNCQGDHPSSPPEEVDDETLTFAILTHLPANQRQIFKNLLGIVDKPLEPPRRAPSPEHNQPPRTTPTPQSKARPEHIVTASSAIQRLYRLSHTPRDAETAIYLLNNPNLHNAIATLAAVSSDEWDILTSGRFDGFLRSGADDTADVSQSNGRYTPSFRSASRGATPAYGYSRRGSYGLRQMSSSVPPPGSGQYGAPIAFDEETEIARLAEVERNIYTGMEALEDAFESLHQKAEIVRRAIRERSAGLAAVQLRRRGPSNAGIEVRGSTPASGLNSLDGRWETDTDDGLGDWDGISEIAPDDSASNISSARRRRPKRRTERRTPVSAIEEDDELYAESEGTNSPRKR